MRHVRDILTTLLATIVVVIATLAILRMRSYHGFAMVGLGFLILGLAKARGVGIQQILADITFGALDTGLMMIFSIIGAVFFGILGAIVGAGLGDAITEAIAGFFEGAIAEKLRTMGIEEARTALRSSLGKMTGCLFGAGICTIIAQLVAII
jgi:hypothetical protein